MAILNLNNYIKDIKQSILDVIGEKYRRIADQRLSSVYVFESFDYSTFSDLEDSDIMFKKQIISSLNYLLRRNGFSNSFPAATYTSIVHKKPQSVVFISKNQEEADHMLIHEFIHALGSRYKNDIVYRGLTNNKPIHPPKDSFVLDSIGFHPSGYPNLDEVLTDLIAKKVMDKRRENNQVIFNNSSSEGYYSSAFMLFESIYNKYADIFNLAYISMDFTLLEDYFGAQNLRQLDNLVKDFMDLANQYSYYNLSIYAIYASKVDCDIKSPEFFNQVCDKQIDKKFIFTKALKSGEAKKTLILFDQAIQTYRNMQAHYNHKYQPDQV